MNTTAKTVADSLRMVSTSPGFGLNDGRIVARVLARLAECKGRKLEQHKLTTHCRILAPDRKCVAWGGKDEMTAAFGKVKLQVK